MKYSFMSFSCPQLTLDDLLVTAKRFGYDGVEPRIGSKHQHGVEIEASPESRAEIRKKAGASGISLSCLATSCVFADPGITKENVSTALKAVDLAADVGAPCIRVFGGRIPKTIGREQAIEVVANALGSMADHAREKGVLICLETHDDWCNPEHVAAIMRRVNHPAIAVNWDIMHPVRAAGATIEQSFQTLKPWIRHLHVHDGTTENNNLVLKPIGTGVIDHRAAVKLMLTVSYSGFISGEWIGWSEPYERYLPRELTTLRGYERGP